MRLKLAGLVVALAFLAVFAIAPATAAQAHGRPKIGVYGYNVSAPLVDPATGKSVGTFNGTVQVTHFNVVDGHLVANGGVSGTWTKTDGTVQQVTDTFTNAPVDPPAGCSILNLTLGPINLNLLGLVIQTNQIHLTITAVPGPGNLLGNLLCDVTNLLNGGGTGTAIQTLLNRINTLLAGLNL